MKTEYNYTIKKINERNTICSVSAEGITAFDLEVPIISNDYEPVFEASDTAERKTEIRQEARVNFRTAIRKYVLDYFAGKDVEAKAKAVTVSPTLLAIEGQSFVVKVNK